MPGTSRPKNEVVLSGSDVVSRRSGSPEMRLRTVSQATVPAAASRECVGAGSGTGPTREPITMVRGRRCATP